MTRVKLNALTGLRIVAAGMIVAHHAGVLQIPVPNYALGDGVSFFFVLSGFIISYAYPKLDSKNEIFKFLAARIARIWPAHFVALLLIVGLFQMPLDRTFVANALLLHGWVPSRPWYFSYNAPSWSISTELFFYISFPVLIFHWDKTWWWKWIGSVILVIALIWLGEALHLPAMSQNDEPSLHGLLYINPLARLFEFVTGMVAYLTFQQLQSVSRKLTDVVFTFLEILVITLAGYSIVTHASKMFLAPYFQGAGMEWFWHSSNTLIFALIVFVFGFGRGWLSRFFGSPPMILLGEISFSIYLVHATIFGFYSTHWQIDHTTPDYLGLIVCVAVTLTLAFMIWALIEVPCRTATKRWLEKRSAFLAPPPAGEKQV